MKPEDYHSKELKGPEKLECLAKKYGKKSPRRENNETEKLSELTKT